MIRWPWVVAREAMQERAWWDAERKARDEAQRGPVERQVILTASVVPERRRAIWLARVEEDFEVGIERTAEDAHQKAKESLLRRLSGKIRFPEDEETT